MLCSCSRYTSSVFASPLSDSATDLGVDLNAEGMTAIEHLTKIEGGIGRVLGPMIQVREIQVIAKGFPSWAP